MRQRQRWAMTEKETGGKKHREKERERENKGDRDRAILNRPVFGPRFLLLRGHAASEWSHRHRGCCKSESSV